MIDEIEVLWDQWSVPHIYATNDDGACFGLGWAQAECHATQLLELFGIARGRAAEHWGRAYRDQDVLAWSMGLIDLAVTWRAGQAERTDARVRAFCAGINAWFDQHPRAAAHRREALPVQPLDIYAHCVRTFFDIARLGGDALTQAFAPQTMPAPGSNAWAVAGSRSSSGNALLAINPHLPWSGRYLFFEAHTVSPDRDFYGACLLGQPWQGMGFNPHAGWAHTVNQIDNVDVFQLVLTDEGYLYDGQSRAFETTTHTLVVRGEDGTQHAEELQCRRSAHGPVVCAPDGSLVAVRVSGVTHDPCVEALEAWWQMSKATTLDEIIAVPHAMQLPMFTVVAASAEGRIAGLFAGRPPVREHGTVAEWRRRLPGDDPTWVSTATHPQHVLPSVVDPVAGFVQSTNDPPWTLTWPPLDPGAHPPAVTFAPEVFPGFRALAAIEPFLDGQPVSFQQLLDLKSQTAVRMADHWLDDLIAAATESADPVANDAADALARWDRHADRDSGGAVLFFAWAARFLLLAAAGGMVAVPWSRDDPFRTPRGLKDPAAAVAALIDAARTLLDCGLPLTTAIGQVWSMRFGGHSAPADGGPGETGVLKVLMPMPEDDGGSTVVFGETFTAIVEFGTPVHAEGVMTYGNRTENPGLGTARQLQMVSDKQTRPLHLLRSDVEQHTTRRELLHHDPAGESQPAGCARSVSALVCSCPKGLHAEQ
jgi:acyl-homoserine-lactone acylase